MFHALRPTLVWLLVLIVVSLGGRPPGLDALACASECPCEDSERSADAELDEVHGDEDAPCDEDCQETCSGCCNAPASVAVVGNTSLGTVRLWAVVTSGPPDPAEPRSTDPTGVFRPPRALA